MIEVIGLARLTDKQGLLSVAFYDCVTGINPSILTNGWVREDGIFVRLNMDDMRRCLEGQRCLCRESKKRILDMVTLARSFDCLTAARCKDAVPAFCRETAYKPVESAVDGVLKETWSSIGQDAQRFKPCQACVTKIQERENTHCRAIWRRLPEFFDLDGTHDDGGLRA
ncbi:hypothetical protein OH76DRAFT_1353128 [Lentinus brumalis]|uniref:Uncharacterized protein n=1 Tax=Lentinus brumalis TaxID=2498619 RepID=A0A371D693_9APHY|nr:hypothetical protein OH76DRAFT_1353128 [Polyporus brumalis]